MNIFKKSTIVLSATFMVFSTISVYAEGDDDIVLENQVKTSTVYETLQDEKYVEVGKYKVETIKDHVYHMDEGTKELPGGATDSTGNMNNPSSIYFVEDDNAVLMVDLGNPVEANSEDESNAKEIIESIVGDKPLTIVFTHSHGDHTGLGTSSVIFENINVDKVYASASDYDVISDTLDTSLSSKLVKLNVDDVDDSFVFDGDAYNTYVVNAHTAGSLMIQDMTNNILFTGDTFGSGFVWLMTDSFNANPLQSLNTGISKAQDLLKQMNNPTILAGHRWQQFWSENAERPNEMSIQYFNDMAQVIIGLTDGTTISKPYDGGIFKGIELSSNGVKAKIDTTQQIVDTYVSSINQMQEAYVYSATEKLSIETVNNTAAATFIIYPDGYMNDEDANTFLQQSGLQDYANTHASQVYIARPSNGSTFTEADVQGFKQIINKISVSSNIKLVGYYNGSAFIQHYLTDYMNFVSGLALINNEKTDTKPITSVPTYVSGIYAYSEPYEKVNNATEVSTEGKLTFYENPNSHYEIVVKNKGEDETLVQGFQNAWKYVLSKFGRIGNYSEDGSVGTWYSRPLITGNASDKTRKYQYFDSVDAITTIERHIYTEDLDGNGVDSLWYVYVPEKVKDANGTVPVVFLMHGNTNDPRTQYDTSGWATIAEEEGIILVCPEWQGHTYQGYTYDSMTTDANLTPESDFITGCYQRVLEDFPQINKERIYISGLSAGSRNTTYNALMNTKYFAAGAGHSGPFKVDEATLATLQESVNNNPYTFPIIYFTGDTDEYFNDWSDPTNSGGLQIAKLFAQLNTAAIPDGTFEETKELYGIHYDETYTYEANAEDIATIKGGILESSTGAEICMNRIYGWGHWNYAPDAKYMWNFLKKYGRNTQTGETIRYDRIEEKPEATQTPTTQLEDKTDTKKPTQSVDTSDTTNIPLYASILTVAITLLVTLIYKKKQYRS